ncbi:hypothetical protein EC991_009095, partial [Linnemannia zychae]
MEGIIDDSPEVEGNLRFESINDAAAKNNGAMSSVESAIDADRGMEDEDGHGFRVKNGQAFQNARERQAFSTAGVQRNVLKA